MITKPETDVYTELQTLMRNCIPQKQNFKINCENISLDNIEKDVSDILKTLNKHVKKLNKKDSFSDVNLQLEKMFQKTNELQKEKQKRTESGEKVVQKTNIKQKPSAPIKKASMTSKVSNRSNSSSKQSTESKTTNSTPKSPPIANKVNIDQLKKQANIAIQQRKTFSIHGNYPGIRRALINRGWIEKIRPSYQNKEINKLQYYSLDELSNLINTNQSVELCKRIILSKLLIGHQVDLYWTWTANPFHETTECGKKTLINRLKRIAPSYSSKQGLCNAAKEAHWYNMPPTCRINLPRTYSLGKNSELDEFVKDFRLTAAMSLVKWVVKNIESRQCLVTSESGKVRLTVFDFAINECYKHIKRNQHKDIDGEIVEAPESEWNSFLEDFYKIVHFGQHFKQDASISDGTLLRRSEFILRKLTKYWHHLKMDGCMNIWILKPVNSSQGQGIHVCRTMKYIMDVVKNNSNRNYIIQKYIERPFLIFNTKFDIRQWFLISCTKPLTIWIYKDCYLRFSSQTYNLRKLHESIHLTNNSVQSKYSNKTRDIALPSYNMWDSNEFKKFLTNTGHPTAWKDIIYPGMKQSITAAILMHQDKIQHRPNSFELYGADFMLTEDFKPFLLEINSSPALYSSTPVTARMCPKVLEDVIKVVVDRARLPKANIGQFELLYRERIEILPKITEKLEVIGKPLKNNYFINGIEKTNEKCLINEENSNTSAEIVINNEFKDMKNSLIVVTEDIKTTLRNLLKLVRLEKKRRLNMKNECVQIKFDN